MINNWNPRQQVEDGRSKMTGVKRPILTLLGSACKTEVSRYALRRGQLDQLLLLIQTILDLAQQFWFNGPACSSPTDWGEKKKNNKQTFSAFFSLCTTSLEGKGQLWLTVDVKGARIFRISLWVRSFSVCVRSLSALIKSYAVVNLDVRHFRTIFKQELHISKGLTHKLPKCHSSGPIQASRLSINFLKY